MGDGLAVRRVLSVPPALVRTIGDWLAVWLVMSNSSCIGENHHVERWALHSKQLVSFGCLTSEASVWPGLMCMTEGNGMPPSTAWQHATTDRSLTPPPCPGHAPGGSRRASARSAPE